MILRCTAKVLGLVGVRSSSVSSSAPSDSDWYLNLIWIDRRKCLLFTHAGTLFPIFATDVRKADLKPVGPYVVGLIREHLRSEGLPLDTLGSLDPGEVHVERTASRSILAYMRDTAIHARYRIEAMGGVDAADTAFLNRYLRRSLHNRDGYVTPLDLAHERLGQPIRRV
jgi:hypothetical protein